MTLKELAEALTRLAAVDPHAEVYFETYTDPEGQRSEFKRICSLVKRDRTGKVTAEPSRGAYVVLG